MFFSSQNSQGTDTPLISLWLRRAELITNADTVQSLQLRCRCRFRRGFLRQVLPLVSSYQQLIPSSNGTAIANALGTDIGNVGRNVLRGPRQSNVDFSVIKRLPISESK